MTDLKIFLGAAFLMLVECPVFSDAILLGGFTEATEPNQFIINLVNIVRPEIERSEKRIFKVFEPVSFVRKIVSGTIYWIKVRHDDGYMHIKIFRPLVHTGKTPVLEQHQMGKNIDDRLTVSNETYPELLCRGEECLKH